MTDNKSSAPEIRAIPYPEKYSERLGGRYHADTELRFQEPEDFERYVLDCIDKQTPVLVDWVDWAGHWQVIIGIDTCGTEAPYDDVLFFADPYDVTNHFQDGYYTFPLARFFYMWREGPCAQKKAPYQQPFVTARPKEIV